MSTTGTMTTDTFPAYRLKSGVLKDHLKNTVFSTSPDREKIQVEKSYNDLYKLTIPRALYQSERDYILDYLRDDD